MMMTECSFNRYAPSFFVLLRDARQQRKDVCGQAEMCWCVQGCSARVPKSSLLMVFLRATQKQGRGKKIFISRNTPRRSDCSQKGVWNIANRNRAFSGVFSPLKEARAAVHENICFIEHLFQALWHTLKYLRADNQGFHTGTWLCQLSRSCFW